ncbi:MAG TPA: radical SAM protein [Bacteroidota bacterium]|nr:radical SAM protein [Bacteroidota bacterium]
MKNDNLPANAQRGSSPPFQDPEQVFYDWMKGLASTGMREQSVSEDHRAGRKSDDLMGIDDSPADLQTLSDSGVHRLDVTLIRPTNYTDDGYPIKTRIGVIRSNTLTQIGSLVRDLETYPFFKGVSLNIRKIDEAIEWIPEKEILSQSKVPGVRSIVMLVGVQSNQYPRALDIASKFLPHGIPVVIGGFHVSGMIAMIGITSDLKTAMARGITLVAGEVEEGRLSKVVEDILTGRAQPLYNFLSPTPNLLNVPIPRITKDEFENFASRFTTIDTGRGCVFNCDFCTIINVQGRTMRHREPKQVVEFVRHSYREAGVSHCFFTDDNTARNPRWRELFSELTRMREEEKIPFTFMMQSDLAARKMPGGDFFELAARAGCNQVFFGVESVNRENLRSQGKFQNQTAEYKDLVAHCHSLGIACHAGYILGLPFDTPESIKQDIGELRRMMFDSASFYILSPLPGSKDHQRWWREKRWMHEDFNTYDSAHVAVKPERMSCDELMGAYHNAWEEFYSTDHMVNVLKLWRHDHHYYRERLSFFMWYLYSSRIERLHPMNCGFWTIRRRSDRRAGLPQEAFVPYWLKRTKVLTLRLWKMTKLFFQLEEVWLRTRPKTKVEEALHEFISKTKKDVVDWRDLSARELAAFYAELSIRMPEVKPPSVVRLWLRKRNPFAGAFSRSSVQRTWRRWYLYLWNPLKWVELWVFEWVHGIRFFSHLLYEQVEDGGDSPYGLTRK